MSWFLHPPFENTLLRLVLLFGVAWLVLIVSRQLVLRLVAAVIRRSPTSWDDALLDEGVFHRITVLLPPIVVIQGLPLIPGLSESAATILGRLSLASIAVISGWIASALLSAANAIYVKYPQAVDRPIKGLLQVVSILFYFAAGILAVSFLIDRSPMLLLSGLGALTAVGMLVFRDTLLSFVAGIQITANGLIRLGDWIEMPQFSADGDVIDIALNTVRVQNWDKTITAIPTHKFLENSFKNWRGMQESGGRRIKRSIHIDVSTIRFLTEEEVEHFGHFTLLRDYIREKKRELEEHNRLHATDPSMIVNVRRLTNVGTLRAYIARYLAQHPGINQKMTSMVRQLQPTAEGLPLELYTFTNDVRWAVYEGTQSDVFDHILAVAPSFGLRIFQSPSGHDFAALRAGAEEEGPENRLAAPPSALLDEDAPKQASSGS